MLRHPWDGVVVINRSTSMNDPYQHMFAPLYALCVEHEQSAPDVDKWRIGAIWRSKTTKRTRIIIEARGDDVTTRFENGAEYHVVTKVFIERLYDYVM
jgi:hypothetical protein